MPGLEWNSELDIGIYEIDAQHRSLVAIANQLCDAIDNGREGRTVEWILEELLLYIKLHFQTEERLMRRGGLDSAESHKASHRQMLKAMRGFMRRIKAGEDDVVEEVVGFLYEWLEQHLGGEDRELLRLAGEAGEAPPANTTAATAADPA